jgi:RNA polymerase-binding transcription factor DksA
MSSPENQNDLRDALESEKARLLSELSDLGFGEEGLLAYDNNFADTSQVTAERGETEALAGELTETLGAVEAALGRIDAGTYGSCERCGEPIAQERLEAMPMASTCIVHASS